MELLVLTGHLLLYPTGVRAERPAPHLAADPGMEAEDAPPLLPTEGRAHPPVLLLHGFIDNRSVFVLLRRALLRGGWRHVYALNHSLLTTDVRTAAEQLAVQVEEICAQTGHSTVDIVGHSLGGLTGRYYVQRLGGEERVRTLVTLGTPHSGTRAAPPLSPHPLLRQIRPGSALLEELARPEPNGCETRFVSVWSDLDVFMVPQETARLDHPDLRVRNIRAHGVGHLSLPVDCAVSARIRRELNGEALEETGEETVEAAEADEIWEGADAAEVTSMNAAGGGAGVA
ncbi:alpha/beta fold hydrolase [Streptomyces sp. ODS28]|uniref:esterase/lipase family protein n=1 Tax=Streptomyces sp. ODS28 TaxID=3136688 RepID=UPI0031EAA2EE